MSNLSEQICTQSKVFREMNFRWSLGAVSLSQNSQKVSKGQNQQDTEIFGSKVQTQSSMA